MSQTSLIQTAIFVLLGLIGGMTHVIVKAESWDDLKRFPAFKRSLLGALCGFIYYFLHSEQDFPNSVMTIISGYMGTDFIKSVIERLQKGTRGEKK